MQTVASHASVLTCRLELVAAYSSGELEYCQESFPGSSIHLAANYQFEASIGGAIDIHIGSLSLFRYDFEPVGIYNMKRPLGSGCITIGGATSKSSDVGTYVSGEPMVNGVKTTVQNDGRVPGMWRMSCHAARLPRYRARPCCGMRDSAWQVPCGPASSGNSTSAHLRRSVRT